VNQSGTQTADQLLAGVGWRHAACGTRQESYTKAFFKAANRMAQRGPRHAHSLRCTREASLFGHSQKGCQDVQIVELHW